MNPTTLFSYIALTLLGASLASSEESASIQYTLTQPGQVSASSIRAESDEIPVAEFFDAIRAVDAGRLRPCIR